MVRPHSLRQLGSFKVEAGIPSVDAGSFNMSPKLVCENYRCKLGSDKDIRVFGMTEYTNGVRSAPGQYIAIVHKNGAPPEKFDAESFDGSVALIAEAFDESEDTVRDALLASLSEGSHIFNKKQSLPATGPKSLIQRIKTLWRKSVRKFFAFS